MAIAKKLELLINTFIRMVTRKFGGKIYIEYTDRQGSPTEFSIDESWQKKALAKPTPLNNKETVSF